MLNRQINLQGYESKYVDSFHPEVNLPFIMRMRGGNNNVNRHFRGKTPKF